jgi:hypothetical protein
VLSAVLIIVAFLTIIVGALMTELSTNFLLSNALVNRVGTEATVSSAAELALNQLQNTGLNSSCPTLNPVTLNSQTATAAYVTCWPTVDRRSPQLVSVASSNAFSVDGMHAVISGNGQNLYLIGDSAGNVFQFNYGQSSPNWSLAMGAGITGPPLEMADVSSSPPDITSLVPISRGGTSGCPANACVKLLGQDVGRVPDSFCFMAANAPVTARPAAGVGFPRLAYFGDSSGWLYAYNATETGNCALQASIQVPSGQAILAGPIVLQNGSNDEVYVASSTDSSTRFLHYTYGAGGFVLVDNISLPAPEVAGMALEPNAFPARVVLTFDGGAVALVRIDAAYHPALITSIALGAVIADAPYWCQCPIGNLIGIGATNGTLYLRDTGLGAVASYAGGSAIHTTPGADAAGNWFFGADDGSLYEVQLRSGQATLAFAVAFASAGAPIRSSPVVGGCSTGICVYMGSTNGHAYLVPLDARDAVLTTCISTAPPACSGANPRLWTQVEVGVAGSPQTVHVQAWSYYSP